MFYFQSIKIILGPLDDETIDPATLRIILKIVGFQAKDSQERGTSLIIKEARETEQREQ